MGRARKRLTPKQWKSLLPKLGMTQESSGVTFGYSKRTGQAWATGETKLPLPVQLIAQLMIEKGLKGDPWQILDL
jgi:DNA-binding transcriptional regulator YiaG